MFGYEVFKMITTKHTKECITYNNSLALGGRSIEGECICDD